MPDHDDLGEIAYEAMVSPPDPETAGVFALLRDIADAEPLATVYDASPAGHAVCTMCRSLVRFGVIPPEDDGEPHPHTVSCPWARVAQIVGRAAHV